MRKKYKDTLKLSNSKTFSEQFIAALTRTKIPFCEYSLTMDIFIRQKQRREKEY